MAEESCLDSWWGKETSLFSKASSSGLATLLFTMY